MHPVVKFFLPMRIRTRLPSMKIQPIPTSVCRHSPHRDTVSSMSAVELAVEKVKRLDESHARHLLAWLQAQEQPMAALPLPVGARAMLGFARRFRAQSRPTSEWMSELREGE
jgi:hypothetical protein